MDSNFPNIPTLDAVAGYPDGLAQMGKFKHGIELKPFRLTFENKTLTELKAELDKTGIEFEFELMSLSIPRVKMSKVYT